MHKYRHHITHVDQRICLQMAPHYGNQTQLLQNQSQLLQSGNPQLSIAGTKCKKNYLLPILSTIIVKIEVLTSYSTTL